MQAPTTTADLWFVVSQILLGVLLAVGGWVLSRLIGQVKELTDKIADLDILHTRKRLELQIDLERKISEVHEKEPVN